MNSRQYLFEPGTINQDFQPQKYDGLSLNYDINKDSVYTSIGHDQKQNEALFEKSINSKNQQLDIKKTKFIWKTEIKKAAPILKHKKVVQTLRNITKNIKNQLNYIKKSKTSQLTMIEEKNQNKIKPQIKQTYQQSLKQNKQNFSGLSNGIYSVDIETQKKSMENQMKEILDHSNQKQMIIEQEANLKIKQEILSPQKNSNQVKRADHVLLYSKYKGLTQSFFVYDDCMLSDKKEFRNLTIHREYDNDVDSDQQQIQMGVGFMYEQLIYSCHRYSEIKQQQKHLLQSSNNKKHKNGKDNVPLEKVKQKLVFR